MEESKELNAVIDVYYENHSPQKVDQEIHRVEDTMIRAAHSRGLWMRAMHAAALKIPIFRR